MGRKVEETMLHFASLWAKAKGARSLCARYCATAKNQPCLRFFEGLGLQDTGTKHILRLELANAFPLPAGIQLICRV
jgi:predicted enzyme involved in methoxymalonyl-ACP biosynthesis